MGVRKRVDLAEIIREAITNQWGAQITQTARRWPDRPIRLELSWMPQMSKLDLVITTIDHLPAYRPALPAPPAA